MITKSETLETLLLPYKSILGKDFNSYRNHLYRVINFCHLQKTLNQESADKIEIAAVFHDLAIWTHNTADYLQHSETLAIEHLEDIDLSQWSEEITQIIRDHHKLTTASEPSSLVEIFRRADWIDVSFGMRSFGLPRKAIKKIQERFPDNGFHLLLANIIRRQFIQHPLNPLPMLKW